MIIPKQGPSRKQIYSKHGPRTTWSIADHMIYAYELQFMWSLRVMSSIEVNGNGWNACAHASLSRTTDFIQQTVLCVQYVCSMHWSMRATIPDKTNETKSLKLSGYVSLARDSPRTPAPPFNVVPKFQLQPFCTNIERGNGGLFHLLLSGSVWSIYGYHRKYMRKTEIRLFYSKMKQESAIRKCNA